MKHEATNNGGGAVGSKLRWYYVKNGRQMGGGSWEMMIVACETGEIDAITLIWDRSQFAWVLASDSALSRYLVAG
jgi:hypothetical protein